MTVERRLDGESEGAIASTDIAVEAPPVEDVISQYETAIEHAFYEVNEEVIVDALGIDQENEVFITELDTDTTDSLDGLIPEEGLSQLQEIDKQAEPDTLEDVTDNEPWELPELAAEFDEQPLETEDEKTGAENIVFESIFSPEEAELIDEELGLVGIVEEAPETEIESDQEVKKSDLIEAVTEQIEALPEEQVEVVQEAKAILASVEQLTGELVELMHNADPESEEKADELREYVEQCAERLLVCLGKEPDEKMVKRFVELLIIHELQNRQARKSDMYDEGTHEKKPHLLPLPDEIDELVNDIYRFLGNHALQLSASR